MKNPSCRLKMRRLIFVPEERRVLRFPLSAENQLVATSIDLLIGKKRNRIKKG